MGYVYIIGSTRFGWYKIGKSSTPDIRVRDIGILLPFKLKPIGVWRAINHHTAEQALHEMYSDNRINGEWFEFTPEELLNVENKIPHETRVYPGVLTEQIDRFSNLEEDTKRKGRVLGLRVQKLRGNFTDEEREAKRVAAIEQQRVKKNQQKKNT